MKNQTIGFKPSFLNQSEDSSPFVEGSESLPENKYFIAFTDSVRGFVDNHMKGQLNALLLLEKEIEALSTLYAKDKEDLIKWYRQVRGIK